MKSILLPALALALGACGPAASDTAQPDSQAEAFLTAAGTTLTVEALDATIEQAMAMTNTPGVSLAVINDGKIIYDAVYGTANVETGAPIQSTTSFEAASLSKPLFGFLAMTFVEDGRLDLDRPLYQYLPHPDIAHDDRYRLITARHVLSHQTGFPNWRSDTPELGLHLKFTPGEGHFYSGEGYEYLADVLMHLADTDDAGLAAIYTDRIARPLGMDRSVFIPDPTTLSRLATPHRDGLPIAMDAPDPTFGAAYSLHSDAGDYARFLIGIAEGDILSPESYADFLAGQNSPIPADDPGRQLGLVDWALGFSVYELPIGTFYTHGGNNPGYSSMAVINPETGWGVVIFTNANQANDFIQIALLEIAGLN